MRRHNSASLLYQHGGRNHNAKLHKALSERKKYAFAIISQLFQDITFVQATYTTHELTATHSNRRHTNFEASLVLQRMVPQTVVRVYRYWYASEDLIHIYHAAPMPFPCHVVPLSVYIVSFSFDLHGAAVFNSQCHAALMPQPCRSPVMPCG
jgi:uncharacterized membrane protein YjjP (DUF1212 family)